MEVLGGLIALTVTGVVAVVAAVVGGLSIVAGAAGLVLPLMWAWMLIDAVLRDERDYPGGTANERLVWVLLIALLQIPAAFYFFMVYVKMPRRAAAGTTA